MLKSVLGGMKPRGQSVEVVGGFATGPTLGLPVFGAGASAGGLEAFSALLSHLDPQLAAAIVLVQHLDPNHPSLLSEILNKVSRLPVVEATDGVLLASGHVYVMPPNTVLTLAAGRLQLKPRPSEGGLTPIDDFFFSLARECRRMAVGVILSGTGSDGAKGLAAIAAAGGTTFAETPEAAKFDGMPIAAIAVGVDHTLSPELIADELSVLARRRADGLVAQPTTAAQRSAKGRKAEDLVDIFALLRVARGMDFSCYKPGTIERRIRRRMDMHNISTLRGYADFLGQQPSEVDCLYEDILIKVTSFFRQPESFAALAAKVLPTLLVGRPAHTPVRVWVPGSASGEEAYSLAMVLIEAMDTAPVRQKIEIFATDISDHALAKGRSGHYEESITEHVSQQRLARFFVCEGSGYKVLPLLRDCCLFAKQNVVFDPPFSKVDLISCRNLLIYLDAEVQRRVLSTFHFALNGGGFLTLGSSETIGTETDLFNTIDKGQRIFSRNLTPHVPLHASFSLDGFSRRSADGSRSLVKMEDYAKKVDLKSAADQAILQHCVAPGVVINDAMDVLQFRGDTSPYLLHPTGDVTVNIFKLCRSGLLAEVRTALHEVSIGGRRVRRDAWVNAPAAAAIPVLLEVIAFAVAPTAQRYFVILFGPRTVSLLQASDQAPQMQLESTRLELELTETKAYLNAIIEKEQATNEELKSASEGILSANEELQSSNEEMATAKEEVQAANEELVTVNDELQHRNLEVGRANSDLANLLSSVQIPIVMLAGNLLIRRFTPAAEKLLNLTARDIGQSLAAISTKLSIETLPKLAAEVIASLEACEQEVQDRSGRWYSLRIKPYLTSDHRVEGAVIVLVDIDALKRNFAALQVAYDYAEAIVQTAPVPLVVLDGHLRVITVNQAFLSHFRVAREDTAVVKIYDLGNGQWDAPGLRRLLEEVLPKNEQMENFIVDHEFPLLGRRTMRLSARRLAQSGKEEARILLAIQDMTDQQRSDDALVAAKEAAETASQAKSEFLANMGHEIRTPLGAILGYAELLANPQQTRTDMLQFATRIHKNVEHLTELIDEVLDIAKIEAGKLEVERLSFKLLPELAETVAYLRRRAVSKGLVFEVRFVGDLPEAIVSCAKRLRQILLNIVGNAVKFTDRGMVSIVVGLAAPADDAAPAKLCFTVIDTGPGLSLEQQQRLFKPFSQADSSVTRRFGGTGLGLILARHLAEALGGDVRLTASEVGKGSTFTISVDPGQLADVPMLRNLTNADLDQHHGIVSDWFVGNKRLAGLHVLLAEDSPDNQLLIARFLKSSGATIEVVGNGIKAVEAAMSRTFDVILMDIQMPLLDGYGATRQLRDQGCVTPVVALTAHSMHGEREKCLDAGCTDYISKPVKPGLLVEIVARAAGKAQVD